MSGGKVCQGKIYVRWKVCQVKIYVRWKVYIRIPKKRISACGGLILLAAFAAVAVAAEHLAVVRRSVTALRPRSNVVGFHLLNLEMFATNRADTFLLFILTTFGVAIESTYLQVPFVCIEHIPINAFLIANI